MPTEKRACWPHEFVDGSCACGVVLREMKHGDTAHPVHAGIAHHHATTHPGGGAGDEGYECFECPFEIEDSVCQHGGLIAVLPDSEPSDG